MPQAPKLVALTDAEIKIICAMIRESQPTARRYIAEVCPLLPLPLRTQIEQSAKTADNLLAKLGG